MMFRVSSLKMVSRQETMFINADTLRSLQIMALESHPNSHNRGPTKSSSGSKEGLSVYGLFRHLARTPQGKFLLRQYFLRPSQNIEVIEERLNTVDIFVRPENDSFMNEMGTNLRNISNMHVVLMKLKKGVGNSANGRTGYSRSIWASLRSVNTFIHSSLLLWLIKLCSLHSMPSR
jgi:DNA mismatch repair protein MSH5